MAEQLSLRQATFTRHVAALIRYAESQGYALTFGETWRPQWVQDRYYAEGATRTKTSKHTQRLAVDFNLFHDGRYITEGTAYEGLGRFWCSLDTRNVWGGDWTTFRDYNHFEMK